MCNVVSGVALLIFKSYFVKSVAAELSETLSVFWPAKRAKQWRCSSVWSSTSGEEASEKKKCASAAASRVLHAPAFLLGQCIFVC